MKINNIPDEQLESQLKYLKLLSILSLSIPKHIKLLYIKFDVISKLGLLSAISAI